MCACAISAECAACGRNFKIAKQAELIPQCRKVIFTKQLHHSDQHLDFSDMLCGIFRKIVLYPPSNIAWSQQEVCKGILSQGTLVPRPSLKYINKVHMQRAKCLGNYIRTRGTFIVLMAVARPDYYIIEIYM